MGLERHVVGLVVDVGELAGELLPSLARFTPGKQNYFFSKKIYVFYALGLTLGRPFVFRLNDFRPNDAEPVGCLDNLCS